MGSAGARRGRPRRRRGRAAARRRRTRRPDRPRRSRSEDAGPSCGRSLGGALLGEELLVELERVGELLRQLRLRIDRVDRARLDAGVAVDADLGIDVELLRRLEVAGARLGVDAVDRTHLDARVVLDAAADDDVGHGPTGYKLPKAEQVFVLWRGCGTIAASPSWTTSTGRTSTATRGSRTTFRTGARGRRAPRRTPSRARSCGSRSHRARASGARTRTSRRCAS